MPWLCLPLVASTKALPITSMRYELLCTAFTTCRQFPPPPPPPCWESAFAYAAHHLAAIVSQRYRSHGFQSALFKSQQAAFLQIKAQTVRFSAVYVMSFGYFGMCPALNTVTGSLGRGQQRHEATPCCYKDMAWALGHRASLGEGRGGGVGQGEGGQVACQCFDRKHTTLGLNAERIQTLAAEWSF